MSPQKREERRVPSDPLRLQISRDSLETCLSKRAAVLASRSCQKTLVATSLKKESLPYTGTTLKEGAFWQHVPWQKQCTCARSGKEGPVTNVTRLEEAGTNPVGLWNRPPGYLPIQVLDVQTSFSIQRHASPRPEAPPGQTLRLPALGAFSRALT